MNGAHAVQPGNNMMIDIASTNEYKKFITWLNSNPKHVRSLYNRVKRMHTKEHPRLSGDCEDCQSIKLVDAYIARMTR